MNYLGEKVFINLQDVQKTPVPRANVGRVDVRHGSKGRYRDAVMPVATAPSLFESLPMTDTFKTPNRHPTRFQDAQK